MDKALILSVGGTVEPLARTLAEHQPCVVCFFASQQTVVHVGSALEKASRATQGNWRPRAYHTVLADDAEDLIHCYGCALQAASWIQRQDVSPCDVIVDYTGGTKTMTAALALATVGKGYSFSYVGGTDRTKGGLGIVVNGAEVVRARLDPWNLFAVEERRRIALAFNAFQFEAALGIIGDLLDRATLDPPQHRWFEVLRIVCEGYRAWDRFEYAEALDRFNRVRKSLETLAELGPEKEARNLAPTVADHARFLDLLRTEWDGFRKASAAMVRDLVGNAQRRAAEGKFDDAVARLYRATEMIGQIRFQSPPLDSPTGEVPPERIPEFLRDEYCTKYLDADTRKLKLPLFAVYRVLQAIGSVEGKAFFSREDDFRKRLNARNQSLLAHGISPVGCEAYEQFHALLRESFGIGEPPVFPRLSLE